jgi:hypothetical protein
MVSMLCHAVRLGHTVVHGVGMGEATRGARAMAEGEHPRRRDEAERRECGERDGEPETES